MTWFWTMSRKCSGALVERAPVLDADRLGDGHVHVADIAPVPHRLEDRVGKTQGEHVLHGLLAHVVVDAVDLRLVEALVQRLVERLAVSRSRPKGFSITRRANLPPGPGLLSPCRARPRATSPNSEGIVAR